MEFCDNFIKEYENSKYFGKVKHVQQEFVRFCEKTSKTRIKLI